MPLVADYAADRAHIGLTSLKEGLVYSGNVFANPLSRSLSVDMMKFDERILQQMAVITGLGGIETGCADCRQIQILLGDKPCWLICRLNSS